ncbi:MAG: phosphoribosylformylglycinamidine synthase subunit PurS [Deltaproteobacteria bacterium]|nr:phosphoribosylformylglycinamidine synthase subunit PurS [Deltaproteobacteria bacterium]
MKVRIEVRLKEGVLDPQGQAIAGSLATLGFAEVRGVRVGKLIEVDVAIATAREAEAVARNMCEQLLVNPVIETAQLVVE